MNKKFFVIDGHALVYRSYFAFIKNPRMTSCGLNTSAIYGFTNTIFRILNIQKPEFLTVVFDTKDVIAVAVFRNLSPLIRILDTVNWN